MASLSTLTLCFLVGGSLVACDAAERGRAAATAAAEEAREEKAAKVGGAAVTQTPPIADRQRVECTTLIDAAAFGTAIGETEPVEVADVTDQDRDAAAVCAIKRGGIRPDAAAQAALIKKQGKLGILAGDAICNVYAYCWTFEEAGRFEARCRDEQAATFDDSLGFPACVRTFQTGEFDVKQYRLYDADTKCVFKIGAGPSQVDNAVVAQCAKAAHDLIGPSNIVPGGPPAGGDADAEDAPAKIML
ncbi:MAG: hypothetical protein R2939_17700 [Kofleriaceae bacterium]